MAKGQKYTVGEDGVLHLIFAQIPAPETDRPPATADTSPNDHFIHRPATFGGHEFARALAILRRGEQLHQCHTISHTVRHHVDWGDYVSSLDFYRHEWGRKKSFQLVPYHSAENDAVRFMVICDNVVQRRALDFEQLGRYLIKRLGVDGIGVVTPRPIASPPE